MESFVTAEELAGLRVFLRHVRRLFASPLATQPPQKVQRSVYMDCINGETTHTWQGYDEERLLAQLPLLRQCLVTDAGTAFTNVCGLVIRKCPSQELRDLGKEVATTWKQILHSEPEDWDAAFFGERLTLHAELMEFFYGPKGLFHTAITDVVADDLTTSTPVRLHMSLSNLFRCLGNAHWIVTQWLEGVDALPEASPASHGVTTTTQDRASA